LEVPSLEVSLLDADGRRVLDGGGGGGWSAEVLVEGGISRL